MRELNLAMLVAKFNPQLTSHLDLLSRAGIKIDFTMAIRKIVHIDMDAFYASVERRASATRQACRGGVEGQAFRRLRSLLRSKEIRYSFCHASGSCRTSLPESDLCAA